jgi:dCTP deaminase
MKLGGKAILEALDNGIWKMYRGDKLLNPEQYYSLVGPNSIDVSLSKHFLSQRIPNNNPTGIIDPWDQESLYWKSFEINEKKGYVLHPGKFILSCTRERLECNAPLIIDGKEHYFVQGYDGRSTMGRLGVASHVTAGFGDYGFQGAFTLELFCQEHPTLLRPEMKIGQIYVEHTHKPLEYKGAYTKKEHYSKPQPPKIGPHRFKVL